MASTGHAQPGAVGRKDLLAVQLPAAASVTRVAAEEISFPAGMKAPEHHHPCAVVGTILSGVFDYQAEGQAVQHLAAGAAFYEPANTRIVQFENVGASEGRFSAFYLCESADGPLTRLGPVTTDGHRSGTATLPR